MKKIIITEHDGGELANQLWNYISIMSYAYECGADCDNWSFFEYGTFFENLLPKSKIIGLFFRFFRHAGRRSAPRARLGRFLYKNLIARPLRHFSRHMLVSTEVGQSVLYLPPTKPASEKLAHFEQLKSNVYFAQVSGAVFRNPAGLEKYRQKLIEKFRPSPKTSAKSQKTLAELRQKFLRVVGIHIRQGDFAVFKGGGYFIPQNRVREIVDQYLLENAAPAERVGFLICSDGPIDEKFFAGLDAVVSRDDAITDLFSLSRCDTIIGSDSTFGHFAAWYGNIPHITMKNEVMDWEYYKGKSVFFVNKYQNIMCW